MEEPHTLHSIALPRLGLFGQLGVSVTWIKESMPGADDTPLCWPSLRQSSELSSRPTPTSASSRFALACPLSVASS